MTAAVVEMTVSTQALLAFQGIAGIEMLPPHLRIRPRLVTVGDQEVPVSAEEREALTTAGILRDGEPDRDAILLLRSLAYPDAELNITLGAHDRPDTFVCLARSRQLVAAAARCGDEVTIDAYVGLDEAALVDLVSRTFEAYLFDTDESPNPTSTIEGATVRLGQVYDIMCRDEPQQWTPALRRAGVPADVAAALRRCETDTVRRGEVAAYINHENGRTAGESIVRATTTPQEAVLTSFATDNIGDRWLTVEPYDTARIKRFILATIRSVPDKSWFIHARSD